MGAILTALAFTAEITSTVTDDKLLDEFGSVGAELTNSAWKT
jgi:hypothetical protein